MGGSNIAHENNYSEVRHFYYVWKNLLSNLDYVGFGHYRRLIFLDPMPLDRLSAIAPHMAHFRTWAQADLQLAQVELTRAQLEEAIDMRRSFTEDDIRTVLRWLDRRDVVVPRMWSVHDRPDLEGQWMESGAPPEMWALMMQAFAEQEAFRPMPIHPVKTAAFNNSFMMRSEIFDRYMTALMAVIDRLKELMHGKPYYPFHRIWGYVAERALNYFLHAQLMKLPELELTQRLFLVRTVPDML